MQFISYAQNFEDVMLWRALKHIKNGFYIDVGACEPENLSVTKAFYDQDWNGLNIEPITQYFLQLQSKRPRDINLQLLAGDIVEEKIFYEIPETGLSTLFRETAERHQNDLGFQILERKVQMLPLTKICESHQISEVHFLKIDVEGAEKIVLDGLDLNKIRPWIIVIEATIPNSSVECYEAWQPQLLSNNYEFVYFDGLNRFYIAKEHSELKKFFLLPPNYFDQFLRIEEWNAREQIPVLKDKENQNNVEIVGLKKNLNERDQVINEINREITYIKGTYSWRITRPIRVIGSFLKTFIK